MKNKKYEKKEDIENKVYTKKEAKEGEYDAKKEWEDLEKRLSYVSNKARQNNNEKETEKEIDKEIIENTDKWDEYKKDLKVHKKFNWKPRLWKRKEIDPEDEEILREKMTELGMDEWNQNQAIKATTTTGFYKKNGIFGLKQYKYPIVFFIRTDSTIEVIEDARAGIQSINVEGEKIRYVLEPKKLLDMPTPSEDKPLKGWILYEEEGMAYPVDVVFSAALQDSIYQEFEARGEFDEWKGGSFWKWLTPQKMVIGLIGFILFFTMGLPALNTYLNPQALQLANETLNQTINITQNVSRIIVP